jgi:hypothetical protein
MKENMANQDVRKAVEEEKQKTLKEQAKIKEMEKKMKGI